jgi:gentisate 1,2-dioxygenase
MEALMAVEPLSRADEMNAFYAEINPKGLDALWRHQGAPGESGPRAPYAPYLWRWSTVRPYMQRTAELVQPGAEAERRVLTLNNPTSLPMQSTTHTISAAVQLVLPGERAPSHRHTMAAIRWVLEGDGAMTFVDGEPCSMHPGDLILTPAWSWHGHLNETSSPMMWMDSLDVPLVRTLRAALYEEYPGDFQETNRQVDESLSRWGAGHLRAVWDRGARTVSPLLSFPWSQTERALHDLARVETSPYDDVAFQFTNPSTGGHVLPTIGCWVQMLRPGIHTQAHRHNTVAVYQVFRGRGSTIVDGVQIDWQQGDFLALPPWAWHEHVNGSPSEEAVLFSTNDVPLYEAINLYREEPYTEHGGHQPVVATYEERYEQAAV